MAAEATAPKLKRRGRGAKSAAIKAYFAESPEAGPTEVVAKLAEKGIKVTPTLVSNIKTRLKKEREGGVKKTKGRGPGRPPRVSNDSISVAALVEAKKFVEQLGSLEAARHALETVSRLSR